MVEKDGMHMYGTDCDGRHHRPARAVPCPASTPHDLLTTTTHRAAIARTPSTAPAVGIAPGAQVPSRRGRGCDELVTPTHSGAAPKARLLFNACIEEQGEDVTQAAQLVAMTAGLAPLNRDKTNEAPSATVANMKGPASSNRVQPELQAKPTETAASAATKTTLPAPSRAALPERPRQTEMTTLSAAAAAKPKARAPSDGALTEHQTKTTKSATSAGAKTPLPAPSRAALPARPRQTEKTISTATAAAKPTALAPSDRALPEHRTRTTDSAFSAGAETPLPTSSRASLPERPRQTEKTISPAAAVAKPTAPALSDRASPELQAKPTETATSAAANIPPYGNRCARKPRYRGFPTGQQGSGRVLVGSLGPDSARWLLGCLHEF